MEKNLPAGVFCGLLLLVLIGCPSPSAPASAPSSTTGTVTGRAILVGNSDHLGLTIAADNGQTISKTQTDKAGAYQLEGLAPGTYTLYASTQDSLEKAVAIGVSVEAGRTVTAPELKLTPTGTLSGVVTLGGKATGNFGILVYLAGTSYSAHTDDTGAWTIMGVPAGTSYSLIAGLAGSNPSTPVAVTVSSGTTTPVAAIALATATALTYTITYNGNGSTGGSAPIDANAYLSGATATVLGNTGNLARTYFTFNGWNTRADGTGTAFTVGSSLLVGTSNLALYAQWTKQIGSTVTVPTPPVYVVTISGPSTVSYGHTATFTSAYTGTAQAYLWFVDGTALASPWGTAASYAYNPTVSTATFGAHLITLLVTDVNGITYSTSQTISVGN